MVPTIYLELVKYCEISLDSVDGEIVDQLRLVVYPILYRVLYIRWLFGISSISSTALKTYMTMEN